MLLNGYKKWERSLRGLNTEEGPDWWYRENTGFTYDSLNGSDIKYERIISILYSALEGDVILWQLINPLFTWTSTPTPAWWQDANHGTFPIEEVGPRLLEVYHYATGEDLTVEDCIRFGGERS